MNNRKIDRTFNAISKQLKAMNARSYEVGLFLREKKEMLSRFWTAEQIIKSISWLKSVNQQGYEIFIRPKGSIGLIFFDDVNLATLEQMKKDGLSPAITLESSPHNYHGWIKISDHSIAEAVATFACKLVARKYNSDIDSADWRHYGRLAGFTNRKPKHIQENGKQPFVLLITANSKLAKNSSELIKQAIEAQKIDSEKQKARQKAVSKIEVDNTLRDPIDFFSSELNGILSVYGINLDASRADWMIVNKMIKIGYSEDSICTALEHSSPALDTRREEYYIKLTLDKAYGRR